MEIVVFLILGGGVIWLARAWDKRRAARRTSTARSEQATRDISAPDRTYIIEYADVDGVVTTRTITLQAIALDSGVFTVEAWCYLRGAKRRFRADRVLSARRATTGDAVNFTSELQGFMQHYLNAGAAALG